MASLSTIYSASRPPSPQSREDELSYPIITDLPPAQTSNITGGYTNPQPQPSIPHPYRPRPPVASLRPYGFGRQGSIYAGSSSRYSLHDYPASTSQSIYGSRPNTRTSSRDPWVPIDPYTSGSRPSVATPTLVVPGPYSEPSLPSFGRSSSASSASSSWQLSSSAQSSSFRLHPPVFSPGRYVRTATMYISSILGALLSQLYLMLLLNMPSHYFNRVTHVYLQAEISVPDVQDMRNAVEDVNLDAWYIFPEHGGPAAPVSPALAKFRILWEDFIASMKSDWKSANVLTVLLLGALLTMLQIDGIEGDPITRTGTLLSLVCALMSLLYGSIYMARFGMMNRLYKAAAWAAEAQRTHTPPWWNAWVFLALPAVWLAWSIIFFAASILSFIWRTGSTNDPEDPVRLAPHHELGPRIGISLVFALGLVYFLLVLRMLRHFGSSMDEAWREKTTAWRTQKVYEWPYLNEQPPRIPVEPIIPRPISPVIPPPFNSLPALHSPGSPELRTHFVPGPYRKAVKEATWRPRSFNQLPIKGRTTKFDPFEIMDLTLPLEDRTDTPEPSNLFSFHVSRSNWAEFMNHATLAWSGLLHVPNMSIEQCLESRRLILQDLVDTWNSAYFLGRHLKVTFSLPDEDDPNDNTSPYQVPQLCNGTSEDGAPSPGPILYLNYVEEEYDTSGSRFYPFPTPDRAYSYWGSSIPALIPPYRHLSSSTLSEPPDELAHPSSTNPLEYQDAPGPYRKALEVGKNFPDVFYSPVIAWAERDERLLAELGRHNLDSKHALKVLDIGNISSAAWERLTTDLRRVLAGQFPIPNLTPDEWKSHRPLILADLLETWNVKYFLKRGVEVVLELDTPVPVGGSGDSAIDITADNQRTRLYPRVPYVIHMDAILHGLQIPGEADDEHDLHEIMDDASSFANSRSVHSPHVGTPRRLTESPVQVLNHT